MPDPTTTPPGTSSPTGPQIWRMQRLLEWLRRDDKLTTRLAAEAFEVSRRTIAADIEYLRGIGVHIEYEARAETYRLCEPFENLPLLALSRSELAAFLVARYALEALGDVPHARVLAQASDRLARHLPDVIRVEPDLLSRAIRFEAGPRPPAPVRALEVLDEAVRNARVLRMEYHSNSSGELTVREVEPYSVLCNQGRWYLIAFCRLRQSMRDFRVDRIGKLEVLDEEFTIEDSFDLDTYLGRAFGSIRGEETHAVHVRFKPYQARWIREEQWHESQVLVEHPDGSLDVWMQVAGLADVARWVLSYGGECEVLGPPALRARVEEEVQQMAEIYQAGPAASLTHSRPATSDGGAS